jgi:alpha-galactosidase
MYFGKRLSDTSAYRSVPMEQKLSDPNSSLSNAAYTPAGTWNLLEPAIEIEHADGNTSLELKYISHTVKTESDDVALTTILLRDSVYGTEVSLCFRTYNNDNVVEQWSVIRNKEKKKIVLKKYASANLYFTANKYFLRHYHGAWANEMKPEETELTAGIKVLDTKLGARANMFQPPSFLLSFDGRATEETGKVMLGTLGWTGNFKIEFEKDNFDNLRLIAGINPYASAYHLEPGKEFQTPSFIYTYSEAGKGAASRNLHRWGRNYRIVDGNGSRLTLLNNWEATYFDFDENKLVDLFQGAKDIGVDMFLLDDGWFANKYPRNDDKAGLGDWQENKKKLPSGIGYLVKEATKAGIKFGIWIEPEMVNPKSELYEKHKNWVIRQPLRKEYYFRNQLVLDLSNPEVQQFVFNVLDSLFIKNPNLAFIKWDCNSVIYNAHSAYLQKKNIPQTHLYVEYVKGLYSVLKKVRAKYPSVPMMLCSGGGGRADYEAFRYFTEFWPSDNTDPIERIFIQWENSYFFPAIVSCNHVTDWSKVSLKFKTDVAMMGKLGFDIVVGKLSESDRTFARNAVSNYKQVSNIIWHGDLYRLADPNEGNIAALMYVDKMKDSAVAFSFLTSPRYLPGLNAEPIKLSGLDPQKNYEVKEINLYPGEDSSLGDTRVYSGSFLMNTGINPLLSQKRSSVVLALRSVKS